MNILGKEWSGEYLDYHCGEGQTRIQIVVWMIITPVLELYFEWPRNMRLVCEYNRLAE